MAAAVPLTLAAVFVIMLATGRVFDRITLGALILGLGLLVDDTIISIEIMVVKMEEGWDRVRAAGYAWSHTAAPMLAGTLVTVIGLIPLGFAQSSAGEYPDTAHPFHRLAIEHQDKIVDYLTDLLEPFSIDRRQAATSILSVIDGAFSIRMLYGTSREVSLLSSAEAVLKSFQSAGSMPQTIGRH